MIELDDYLDATSVYSGSNKALFNMIRKMILKKRDDMERHIGSSTKLSGNSSKVIDKLTTETIPGTSSENRTNSNLKMYFHKFSPFNKKSLKIQCNGCSNIFESVRGHRDHARKAHPELNMDSEEVEEMGRCLLAKNDSQDVCNRKFTTDQIVRHFKVNIVK